MFENTLKFAQDQDRLDSLSELRNEFLFPQFQGRDVYYFCGNSLGLQPKKAKDYVLQELEDWKNLGVEGHLQGKRPWYPYHEFVTNSLARLAGALPSEVVAMNSLSVNLHLLMASFYRPTPSKNKILIEGQAFPSDQYAVKSQIRFHGFNPETSLLEVAPNSEVGHIRKEDLLKTIDEKGKNLALILLGQVNFVTGQAFPIKEIVALARKHGIFVGLDLAHGMGNLPLELHDWDVDFAAWCSYKYLNAGPGATAGVFIHEKHLGQNDIPRFEGWWGHDKVNRFQFAPEFSPMPTAEAWQLSNPAILPLACLRASLDVFDRADLKTLRQKSEALTGYLEFILDNAFANQATKLTPLSPQERGCQLSYKIQGNAKELSEKLSQRGFAADARGQVLRFAPTPLYNRFEDVYQLGQVINEYCAK